MKKTIIPFLILLCFQVSFNLKAQNGYLDNNPIWVVHRTKIPPLSNPSHNCDTYYYFKGDTNISGHTYHKQFYKELCTEHWNPGPTFYYNYSDTVHPCYLRDTLRQIRYWDLTYGGDSVLYDFDLHVGDSIFPSSWTGQDCGRIITEIDSIPVSNSFRKRFTYQDTSGFNYPEYLYEGIGWETGLFPNTWFCSSVSDVWIYQLTCYSVSDTIWFPNYNPVFPCAAPDFTVGIKETQAPFDNVLISPNPFIFKTTITFNEEQKNTSLRIFDVVGQEIKAINFTGKELTIEQAGMKAGIYFIQIMDINKNKLIKKIIVQ
jgi:hypothetical protein